MVNEVEGEKEGEGGGRPVERAEESRYALKERGRLMRRVLRGEVERQRREKLAAARTFREFLHVLGRQNTAEVLDEYSIVGPVRLDYYVFIRSCIKDIYDMVWKYMNQLKPEDVDATLDQILDYAEGRYVQRFNLKPEPLARIEVYLRSLVKNLPGLEEQFLRLHGDYPPKVKR